MPKTLRTPDGSNWGRWGWDDTVGTLNLVTSKVRKSAWRAGVKTGDAFCLSLPLDTPRGVVLNENRLPPVIRPNLRFGVPNFHVDLSLYLEETSGVLSDDLAVLHLQYSTQWDALAHYGVLFDADGNGEKLHFYNGFTGQSSRGPNGVEDAGFGRKTTSHLGPLSVDAISKVPLQTRAVLVDLERAFGRDAGVLGWNEIEQELSRLQVDMRPGDVLLVRTGFAGVLKDKPEELSSYTISLDGNDTKLKEWIRTSGIAAIAADNLAVEGTPARVRKNLPCVSEEAKAAYLPLHEHCLFKLGMPLGELWYLDELAEQMHETNRTYCLLSAPPLRLPGASGSPLTPIATL
ncbi:cyclase [Corynebacterium hadale]|uniref:Cyclase n=1 Tax=Corynebacterium hadale TaxID=2026255 RepID=A0ABX4HA14_9CORY|nr:cyclase family protein [Corynebacterium hadale]PAT06090.1 cyclase [Corynebacterium hadale]